MDILHSIKLKASIAGFYFQNDKLSEAKAVLTTAYPKIQELSKMILLIKESVETPEEESVFLLGTLYNYKISIVSVVLVAVYFLRYFRAKSKEFERKIV